MWATIRQHGFALRYGFVIDKLFRRIGANDPDSVCKHPLLLRVLNAGAIGRLLPMADLAPLRSVVSAAERLMSPRVSTDREARSRVVDKTDPTAASMSSGSGSGTATR